MLYKVRSGEIDCLVNAKDFDEAVDMALDENPGKSIALIVGVLEIGKPEEEELYCLTENILKKLGRKIKKAP